MYICDMNSPMDMHLLRTFVAAYEEANSLVRPLCDLEPERPIRLDVEPYFKIAIPSLLRYSLHTLLDESFRTGRIVPARIIEIDGLAGALEFLSMTDWIALLPAATAYNNSERSSVRFNPMAGDEIPIDYFVAYARTEPISIAAQAFIDLATAELNLVAAQWRSRLSNTHRHRRDSRKSQSSGRR
jgi:DNA-binding transcriptional LysR family regulator